VAILLETVARATDGCAVVPEHYPVLLSSLSSTVHLFHEPHQPDMAVGRAMAQPQTRCQPPACQAISGAAAFAGVSADDAGVVQLNGTGCPLGDDQDKDLYSLQAALLAALLSSAAAQPGNLGWAAIAAQLLMLPSPPAADSGMMQLCDNSAASDVRGGQDLCGCMPGFLLVLLSSSNAAVAIRTGWLLAGLTRSDAAGRAAVEPVVPALFQCATAPVITATCGHPGDGGPPAVVTILGSTITPASFSNNSSPQPSSSSPLADGGAAAYRGCQQEGGLARARAALATACMCALAEISNRWTDGAAVVLQAAGNEGLARLLRLLLLQDTAVVVQPATQHHAGESDISQCH
jgi:hypothetical protein